MDSKPTLFKCHLTYPLRGLWHIRPWCTASISLCLCPSPTVLYVHVLNNLENKLLGHKFWSIYVCNLDGKSDSINLLFVNLISLNFIPLSHTFFKQALTWMNVYIMGWIWVLLWLIDWLIDWCLTSLCEVRIVWINSSVFHIFFNINKCFSICYALTCAYLKKLYKRKLWPSFPSDFMYLYRTMLQKYLFCFFTNILFQKKN